MGRLTEEESDWVNRMVDAIVREVDPLRIILFGSRARGAGEEESDYDLLIVQDHPFPPGPGRIELESMLYRVLARLHADVDLLVYTPKEVELFSAAKNHIVSRAVQEGFVVYERS